MRSHPYTPPPPLPPVLSELSTYLPNRDRRVGSSASDSEVGLSDLDPETSRLLPRKRQQHHVRIQGKLAPVRSVSVVSPRSVEGDRSALSPREDTQLNTAVGGTMPRRRRRRSSDTYSEARGRVGERDTQLRGYGIGGAGNIRRPTDVIGTSSRTSSRSLSSLFSSSSMTAPSEPGLDKKSRLSELWSRIEERRGK
ncbi:hypothetical protein F4819DRAFT_459760 [Hypoxylon fuscum]|nr:hypothetical protein F4819DRAFT_459760 [Hypoxylon fuscum]